MLVVTQISTEPSLRVLRGAMRNTFAIMRGGNLQSGKKKFQIKKFPDFNCRQLFRLSKQRCHTFRCSFTCQYGRRDKVYQDRYFCKQLRLIFIQDSKEKPT